MLIREIMEILHTTGIHKQVRDPKKVRKKGSTFCLPKMVRSESSPFFNFFLIMENTCNTQMIAAWYKTYIQHFGKEMKKKR